MKFMINLQIHASEKKKIQKLRFCLQAYLMKTTQLKQRNELTTHLKHNNYQTGINNLEKLETEQL